MNLKTAILAVELLACLAVGLAAVPLMAPAVGFWSGAYSIGPTTVPVRHAETAVVADRKTSVEISAVHPRPARTAS